METIVQWMPIILASVFPYHSIGAGQAPQEEEAFHWPDQTLGAVTLSYDDALPIHFTSVAPQLEKAGLRGTFYISIDFLGFREHIDDWRRVAAAGHELGNHTLFHPCRKDDPNERPWLSNDYNLSLYGPERWRGEVRVANLVLQLVDGKTLRTFGNTCCDNTLGPLDNQTCLEDIIPEFFVAARGQFLNRPIDPKNANLAALGHYGGDGKTFAALRQEIESAISQGKWILYMTHGVGQGTHSLYIDTEEHRKLIDYLAANRDRIWTAPAVDVATYIRQFKGRTQPTAIDMKTVKDRP